MVLSICLYWRHLISELRISQENVWSFHDVESWGAFTVRCLFHCTMQYKILPSKPLTVDLKETLDLFFRRACYHWNASYRKLKRIKVVEKLQIYKYGFVHFFCVRDSSTEATELAIKSPKFPWGSKLNTWTVRYVYFFNHDFTVQTVMVP